MRVRKDMIAKVLSAVMVFSLAAAKMPGKESLAAEVTKPYVPNHGIEAYMRKDIYETETVKVSGVKVEEVINASTSPVLTRKLEKPVKFQIYNTTTQEIEQEVTSENGVLPDMNLIKNHNYTIFALDSDYRMPNRYLWVKADGIVDIKDTEKTYNSNGQLTNVTYKYSKVESLKLYKRDQQEENPEDDRRVRVTPWVQTELGGRLSNIKFELVSDVETIEAMTDNTGKLNVELLEDVNYMVTVDNDQWGVASFPLSVKDKSEYDAEKYGYNHSNCQAVDEIILMNKKDVHKKDTILTNSNYSGTVYADMAGDTTIEGLDFQHFLISEKELDKTTVNGMDGKDYEVLDIKLINPHRWEIAKLSAGEYKITTGIEEGKTVEQVYYMDKEKKLQKLDSKQSGNQVTFQMNSLSLYPIVIEYAGGEPAEPEVDNYTLNIKVVDEKGKAAANEPLYLKSTEYGEFGNVELGNTDTDGKISLSLEDEQSIMDDTYELQLSENERYTCANPPVIVMELDGEWNVYIESVNDEPYTGEVTMTIQSAGGGEPVEPEVDNHILNIKVVDGKGKAVVNEPLYLKSTEYGEFGNIELGNTDADGKVSYTCDNSELSDDEYLLSLKDETQYTCVNPPTVAFGEENFETYVESINGEAYTGEVIMTVQNVGGGEPVEPAETEFHNVTPSVKEIKEAGGKVTVTVEGKALPEVLYYGIHYLTGTGNEKGVVEYQKAATGGTPEKRTFEIEIPDASQYPDAVTWRIGVEAVPDDGYYFFDSAIAIVRDEIVPVTKETREALEKVIEEALGLTKADYTAESWAAYSEAVAQAKELLKGENPTEEGCKAALQLIREKKALLEKASTDPIDPKDPADPKEPFDTGKSTDAGKPGSQTGVGKQSAAPATGDTANVLPLGICVVAALGSIVSVLVIKKRKMK